MSVFPSNNISIGTYDINKQIFPIQININNGGHSFYLNGNVKIQFTIAERFKNDFNNSLIKVNYISRIIIDKIENENLLSYEYTNVSILYRGGEYTVDGDIQINKMEEIPPTVLRDKKK